MLSSLMLSFVASFLLSSQENLFNQSKSRTERRRDVTFFPDKGNLPTPFLYFEHSSIWLNVNVFYTAFRLLLAFSRAKVGLSSNVILF